MTAAPNGQKKAAEENKPAPDEEPTVQVTHPAEEGEPSDPAGAVTEKKPAPKTAKKKDDPLLDVDASKLPLSVSVDEVLLSVEEYSGRAVLSFSLQGWVGDAPFKVLASDVTKIEGAIAQLRKELS
jgi:hypothetical protein|tara:strand:- start:23809 stop:24186 length:378 start_codon:yes stop_codon:yes gene_type:complete